MVLRLAFNRLAAVLAGGTLLLAAAALGARNYSWESWATDGLGLVLGATGAALVWTAVSGRRPDWVDPGPPSGGA